MADTQTKSKLDMLRDFAAKDPKNAFPRYGVAMELAGLGRLEESVETFRALAADVPGYVPLYFHAGKTLERLGREDEAREMYRRGITAAASAGNRHAQDELEAALGLLG